ncbi:hypothetical protein [Roseovarius amoyensis]|uniref:hypothetical protein n=1 Tax=Roseovarius amoyensis TaxID=2211448 RepID=UPI0013A6E5B4|nr:hypothetical protein [Roseovarius amoyensis]
MRKTGLIAGLLMTVAFPLTAQELPKAEDLEPRVGAALPPYWEMSDFRLIAAQLKGDAIEPVALIRFEADVSPGAPLYTATNDYAGPFALIIPTVGAETNRTLYGTMQLYYKAGGWSGGVELENPVGSLGQPRDMFVDPTLVLGSEEQNATLAKIHNNAVAAEKQKLAKELAELRGEHEVKMSSLRSRLARERDTLTAEIEETKAEHEKALADTEAQYNARLETLRENYDPRIAAEEKKLKQELKKLRAGHATSIASLRKEQTAELEDIQVEFARQRSAMRQELEAKVAALEVELAAEIERLETRLASSQEAQRLQSAYLESIEARSQTAAALRDAMETAMARRVSLLQMLPSKYRGGVRCRDADGRIDKSWQLAFDVIDTNPSGMHARFAIDSTRTDRLHYDNIGTANLLIRSEELALPLNARLSFAGAEDAEHLPATVDVTISESLVISGTETTVWNIESQSTPVSCVFELS